MLVPLALMCLITWGLVALAGALHTSEWGSFERGAADVAGLVLMLSPFVVLRRWVKADDEPPR
jgi:hypothetical protein